MRNVAPSTTARVCESEQFTACSKHYSVIAYRYVFDGFINKIMFKNLPLNMHIDLSVQTSTSLESVRNMAPRTSARGQVSGSHFPAAVSLSGSQVGTVLRLYMKRDCTEN